MDAFNLDTGTFNSITAGSALRCNGDTNGSASVSVSGATTAVTYLWSNGDTTQSLSNVPAGTYTVVITDANGCMGTDSAVVTQPLPLNGNINIVQPTCNGLTDGSASLNPSGGNGSYGYVWSSGSTMSSISGLSAGSYSYLLSDGQGCITNATFIVTEPDTINLQPLATDIACFGETNGSGTLMPIGGNGGFTYFWNTGQTTSTISGLSAGFYFVTATDMNGCTGTTSIMISEPPLLQLSIVTTPETAPGANDGAADLTISGGTPPYASISWDNGATTEDLTGLAAGVYAVTVTDANGCTTTDSIAVLNNVGISDAFDLPGFSLYPNPTHKDLFVTYSLDKVGPVSLTIVDVRGKQIMTQMGSTDMGANTVKMDVEKLPSAVYILVVENPHGKGYVRWIKE